MGVHRGPQGGAASKGVSPSGGAEALGEEFGGEGDEVVAPDGPGVGAWGDGVFVGDAFFFEQGVEGVVGGEEEVVLAAADPEEFEVSVDGGGVGPGFADEGLAGDGGAEGADLGKLVAEGEGDGEGVAAAHAEAGEGAGSGGGVDVIGLLDEGDDVAGEFLTKGGGIGVGVAVGPAGAGGEGVGVGHDDEHGLGFFGGDEAIEDPVGLAVDGPGLVVVAEAVAEVEDGEGGAVGAVAWGGVDDEAALLLEDFGGVVELGDGAVGDVLEVPGSRGMGGHVEDAAAGGALGFDGGVEVVDDVHAVDLEMVFVDAGGPEGGGAGPEAVGAFGEGEFGAELAGDLDFAGLGGAAAEGDAAVGLEFWGEGRLSGRGWPRGFGKGGESEGGQEEGEQGNVHAGSLDKGGGDKFKGAFGGWAGARGLGERLRGRGRGFWWEGEFS